MLSGWVTDEEDEDITSTLTSGEVELEIPIASQAAFVNKIIAFSFVGRSFICTKTLFLPEVGVTLAVVPKGRVL